jgi:quercetin dioxygenase-like cupin family protein
MRITRGRISDAPSMQRTTANNFSGTVWSDPLLTPEDDVYANTVFFAPGGRTFWHAHGIGQVLYVTHGRGFIAGRDGVASELVPGDVVHVPAGEEHWHGAAPESYVVHFAVSMGPTDWLEEVAEEHYRASCAATVSK